MCKNAFRLEKGPKKGDRGTRILLTKLRQKPFGQQGLAKGGKRTDDSEGGAKNWAINRQKQGPWESQGTRGNWEQ